MIYIILIGLMCYSLISITTILLLLQFLMPESMIDMMPESIRSFLNITPEKEDRIEFSFLGLFKYKHRFCTPRPNQRNFRIINLGNLTAAVVVFTVLYTLLRQFIPIIPETTPADNQDSQVTSIIASLSNHTEEEYYALYNNLSATDDVKQKLLDNNYTRDNHNTITLEEWGIKSSTEFFMKLLCISDDTTEFRYVFYDINNDGEIINIVL